MEGWGQSHPETSPLIGSPPFKYAHLNQWPDIPLAKNIASYCLPQEPNQNHSIPPIDITVLTPIPSWSGLPNFYEVIPMFMCITVFRSLTVRTLQEYVSIFSMQRCLRVIEPGPFCVQSHSSIIPSDQGSITV